MQTAFQWEPTRATVQPQVLDVVVAPTCEHKSAPALLEGADALLNLSGHRRQQVWEASGLRRAPKLLRDAPVDEQSLELDEAAQGEEVVHDYSTIGLTLRSHPLELLRPKLAERRLSTAGELHVAPQPDTAKGVIFTSLEDETGIVQVIVWKSLRERQRPEVPRSRVLCVYGVWQREGEVMSLIAGRLEDLSTLLGELPTTSRDFL